MEKLANALARFMETPAFKWLTLTILAALLILPAMRFLADPFGWNLWRRWPWGGW